MRLTKIAKSQRHSLRLARRYGQLPPPTQLLGKTRCVRCRRWHASLESQAECLTPWLVSRVVAPAA